MTGEELRVFIVSAGVFSALMFVWYQMFIRPLIQTHAEAYRELAEQSKEN